MEEVLDGWPHIDRMIIRGSGDRFGELRAMGASLRPEEHPEWRIAPGPSTGTRPGSCSPAGNSGPRARLTPRGTRSSGFVGHCGPVNAWPWLPDVPIDTVV